MEKNHCLQWLEKWFKENTGASSPNIHENFFSNGLLNSFKTLQLVSDIETFFKLAIPDNALTDPRFSSIDGIALILDELTIGCDNVK